MNIVNRNPSTKFKKINAIHKKTEPWSLPSFCGLAEGKTAREPMPDRLWQAAEGLYHTRKMAISRVAQGLRLNYSTLKAKILDMPIAVIYPPEEKRCRENRNNPAGGE